MALYVLKDKVSHFVLVPHKHIVSPTTFGWVALACSYLFPALRLTLRNIFLARTLGIRKIRSTEAK